MEKYESPEKPPVVQGNLPPQTESPKKETKLFGLSEEELALLDETTPDDNKNGWWK